MRVLIVEDEAIIALCIRLTLLEAGHEIMGPAARLDECLTLVEKTVPDLALIDIGLEGSNSGIDVARVLRERWRVMSIYVSAYETEACEHMDVALGCLSKPFATASLVGTVAVAEVLQRGAVPLRLPEGLRIFPEAQHHDGCEEA